MPGDSGMASLPRELVQREYEQAAQAWGSLLDEHLLPAEPDAFWRFSRLLDPARDPSQGWKLHLSATTAAASDMVRRAAGVLGPQGAMWKAPATLQGVRQLNAGLLAGYPQIGKVVTVYPASEQAARRLAAALDAVLVGIPGPRVPFDRVWRAGSAVHYRYGVHLPVASVEVDGRSMDALRRPDGTLVPDLRRPDAAVPDWVLEPLASEPATRPTDSLLSRRYLAYASLTQRGKGGTYEVLDVVRRRRCILREGRRHGETDLDGRDGRDRVAHEEQVLRSLRTSGVRVPVVLDAFEAQGHQYLVLEHLGGHHLGQLLAHPNTLADSDRLVLAVGTAELVSSIHAAGWAWRDCKTTNIMVTEYGPYAIDLEGACRLDRPDPWPWGSPGHVPPEWPYRGSAEGQDLYALGVVLKTLASRPEHGPEGAPRRRPDMLEQVEALGAALTRDAPGRRPSADAALRRLSRIRAERSR